LLTCHFVNLPFYQLAILQRVDILSSDILFADILFTDILYTHILSTVNQFLNILSTFTLHMVSVVVDVFEYVWNGRQSFKLHSWLVG
jgi:hypothetical protein